MSPNSSPNSTVVRHRRHGPSRSGTGAHHYKKKSDLNYMKVCRRSRLDNYWNPFNRFLFIIIIVIHATKADETNCSNAYKTCTECTKNDCKWDVLEQKCTETRNIARFSLVSLISNCPKFAVQWQKDNVVVTVSNDRTNLVSWMKNAGPVHCWFDKATDVVAKVDGDRITCKREPMDDFDGTKARQMVHLSVVFAKNSRTLLFDDVSDHYQRVDGASKTTCQTHCGWHDERFMYYCTWCDAAGQTAKEFQYCDKRVYPLLRNVELDHDVTFNNDRCATVEIESFKPSCGEWIGGTVLEIVVKHHQLFLSANGLHENKLASLSVTVAGRDCESSKASKTNTITCTLSQPQQHASPVTLEGPVKVKYSGLIIGLMFVSSQTFKFFENTTPTSQLIPPTPSLHMTSNPSETQSSNLSMTSPSTPSLLQPSTASQSTTLTSTTSPSTTPTSTPSPSTTPTSTASPSTPSSPLLPSLTSSPSPPSTSLQSMSSNSFASPMSNPFLLLSSTVLPFSSSTLPSTTTFPRKVNITKEAFNNNNTISRTTPVLSTVVTIMMYLIFIMVSCVALICLKSPRTYNLLTFHLRQRPMQMRQMDEDQHLPLSITDFNENEDGYDETTKRVMRDKNQSV